jgi:hypothetical protein
MCRPGTGGLNHEDIGTVSSVLQRPLVCALGVEDDENSTYKRQGNGGRSGEQARLHFQLLGKG